MIQLKQIIRFFGVLNNVLIIIFISQSLMIFGQGLKQSHHDFSNTPWGGEDGCKPCHTAQNNFTEIATMPIWDQQSTNLFFEVYSSKTMDSKPDQPNGKSKLCLSCHDGTVAMQSHGGIPDNESQFSSGNQTLDLRDDHPISFVYDSALVKVDHGLYDPYTTLSGLGGTIEEDLLENGKMECTSCHDVHISRNTEGCKGCHIQGVNGIIRTISLSLWKSNDKSALCLTCHKK